MFKRVAAVAVSVFAIGIISHASEEKVRGLLEKTVKPDACAQITDALNEMYYVVKTDAAEKMVANYVGKNQKVVVTGAIETRPNETVPFVTVTAVEVFNPKMPPAPPVAEKKDEKTESKKEETKAEKKEETKK